MKQPWLAYVVVILLAAGVGVLVAGFPDLDPAEATITSPATPDQGGDPNSPGDTGDTDGAPATDAPATTPAPTTTDAPATTPPTTTRATTTTIADDIDELPDRAVIPVVVANGAGVPGAAAFAAGLLEGIGYADVALADGTERFERSVVYHADGFEAVALRLAADLEIDESSVFPLTEAPPIEPAFPEALLLVYLGRSPG
jgi:hypothetical protein